MSADDHGGVVPDAAETANGAVRGEAAASFGGWLATWAGALATDVALGLLWALLLAAAVLFLNDVSQFIYIAF